MEELSKDREASPTVYHRQVTNQSWADLRVSLNRCLGKDFRRQILSHGLQHGDNFYWRPICSLTENGHEERERRMRINLQ